MDALRRFVLLAAAGVVALVAGVVWDLRLHAGDPLLAASEGVTSFYNPGHLLAALGLVLVVVGVGGASWAVWIRHRPPNIRRTATALVVLCGMAAGGALVAGGAQAAGGHGDEVTQGHGRRDYAALWDDASSKERAAATALVESTRAATSRYTDYQQALAAGYRPNARAGETATHHPNPALMRDGKVLDPTAPESLVYWTAPGGGKVLVGVVYKAGPTEAAPAPGGELTAWHTHAGGAICRPASDAGCPEGTAKMLHVFLFDGVTDPFTENMVAAAGGRGAFREAMRD